MFLHGYSWEVMALGLLGVLFEMSMWWHDGICEAVDGSFSAGRRLACASVWRCSSPRRWCSSLHSSAPSSVQPFSGRSYGSGWPPKGIHPFDPWNLPFANSLILLSSGTTVTWAHHVLINGGRKG